MHDGLPLIDAADSNTDIGKVIVEGGFGLWCESDDADAFAAKVDEAVQADTAHQCATVRECLQANYTTEHVYGPMKNSLTKPDRVSMAGKKDSK